MRFYHAVCEVLEAYAARLRTDTLENEFDNADWAMSLGADDDD
jgi:hypothetical protein